MKKAWFLGVVVILILSSCRKDTEEDCPVPAVAVGDVNVILDQFPFETLSEYNFFVGEMSNQSPNTGVQPYDIIAHLFTDYALKKRFVWIPPGEKAHYVGDHKVLEFPVGTVIIKNFYYNNVQPSNTTRIIETRLLVRKQEGWRFGEYVWNDDQTEAYLDLSGSYTDIEWIDENGVDRAANYRIPSDAECFTCHKNYNIASPIGPKPQNMNFDQEYTNGSANQLQKWMDLGYLEAMDPSSVSTVVDYTDINESLLERSRAYIDINCSHCHQEGSHCDYRPMRFAYSETTELINLGVCVEPNELINSDLIYVISPGNSERSVMHFRLGSTAEEYRMPLLGRTIVHEEGLELIENWINSLDIVCQ